MYKSFICLVTFLVVIDLSLASNQSENATLTNRTDADPNLLHVYRFNTTEYHRIQIKPNVTLPLKNYKIKKTNFRYNHEVPLSLIFETDNSFYFLTRVDHKANLTVNFNYRVSPKKMLVTRYEYQVNERPVETYKFELEITFKNLDFNTFLTKEKDILEYFNEKLGNVNMVVSGIVEDKKNLQVVLVSLDHFSRKTKNLARPENCNKMPIIADGLEIVPCSIKFQDLKNVTNRYASNTLDLDLDVITSNSLLININHLLLAAVLCIQIYFLA